MALTLLLVRLDPTAFARVEANPAQLCNVLDGEPFAPELGIAATDISSLDYREVATYCEQHDAPSGEGDDHDGVLRDLGADGTLAFDTGHGPAFCVSPANVKRAAATSILVTRDAASTAFYAAAEHIVGMIVWSGPRRACLCCDYLTLENPPFEICPVCFYQDDTTVLSDGAVRSAGANVVTLDEARANYRTFGACDPRSRANVRAPRRYEYRPIE